MDATEQGGSIGFGKRGQPGFARGGGHEAVDGVARPAFAGLGRLGPDRGHEGPVRFIFRALLDPADQHLAFRLRERTVQVGRRHDVIRIRAQHPSHHLAVLDVAGNDGPLAALQLLGRARQLIQPQPRLAALVGIGSVAAVAAVGEDGTHVPVEADGRGRIGDDRAKRKQEGRGGPHQVLSNQNHGENQEG